MAWETATLTRIAAETTILANVIVNKLDKEVLPISLHGRHEDLNALQGNAECLAYVVNKLASLQVVETGDYRLFPLAFSRLTSQSPPRAN